MSQRQNVISILKPSFNPKLKPKLFLLNCHPGSRGVVRRAGLLREQHPLPLQEEPEVRGGSAEVAGRAEERRLHRGGHRRDARRGPGRERVRRRCLLGVMQGRVKLIQGDWYARGRGLCLQ